MNMNETRKEQLETTIEGLSELSNRGVQSVFIDAAIIELSYQMQNEGQSLPKDIAMQNVKDIAHCLSDIRRFVEAKFMTVGDLPSPEGLLLSGPEWKHESDAIIAALNRVAEFYEMQYAPSEIDYAGAKALFTAPQKPVVLPGIGGVEPTSAPEFVNYADGWRDGINECRKAIQAAGGIVKDGE